MAHTINELFPSPVMYAVCCMAAVTSEMHTEAYNVNIKYTTSNAVPTLELGLLFCLIFVSDVIYILIVHANYYVNTVLTVIVQYRYDCCAGSEEFYTLVCSA